MSQQECEIYKQEGGSTNINENMIVIDPFQVIFLNENTSKNGDETANASGLGYSLPRSTVVHQIHI